MSSSVSTLMVPSAWWIVFPARLKPAKLVAMVNAEELGLAFQGTDEFISTFHSFCRLFVRSRLLAIERFWMIFDVGVLSRSTRKQLSRALRTLWNRLGRTRLWTRIVGCEQEFNGLSHWSSIQAKWIAVAFWAFPICHETEWTTSFSLIFGSVWLEFSTNEKKC